MLVTLLRLSVCGEIGIKYLFYIVWQVENCTKFSLDAFINLRVFVTFGRFGQLFAFFSGGGGGLDYSRRHLLGLHPEVPGRIRLPQIHQFISVVGT